MEGAEDDQQGGPGCGALRRGGKGSKKEACSSIKAPECKIGSANGPLGLVSWRSLAAGQEQDKNRGGGPLNREGGRWKREKG